MRQSISMDVDDNATTNRPKNNGVALGQAVRDNTVIITIYYYDLWDDVL